MIGDERGKTLIELSLVAVIITIVAAMAMANQQAGVQNKHAIQARNSLETLEHAVRAYGLDYQGPARAPSVNDLVTLGYIRKTDLYLSEALDPRHRLRYTVTGRMNGVVRLRVTDSPQRDIGRRRITCQLLPNRDYREMNCNEVMRR